MSKWWESAPVVGQTQTEQWWTNAPLASGAAQAGDIAASFGSGVVRGIPETVEFLGAATATLPSAAISAARGNYQGLGQEFRGLMAEAPLTPAINQAIGEAYQPQTEAGRYARAIGAGASTGVIGGLPGVVSGIAGGAGAEAGGDVAAATLGEEYRPVGGLVGGLLGGASTYRYGAAPVARGLSKPTVDVPTADDIRGLANQKYQQAAQAGGVFSPAVSNKFLAEATKGFEAPSELAAKAAKPSEALKYIEDFRVFADKPMTLADAQYLDEYLGDAVDTFVDQTTGKVSKQGQKLLDVQNKLRSTVLEAPESEIVGGRAGVEALAEGRKLWQKQAKLRDIEKIITRAELSQNPATALKTGFKTLYTNPSRMRGYTEQEKSLIKAAAETGKVQDLMQTFGSRILPVVTAASGGGVLGTLGATTGSALARTGASAAQMGRANRLVEAVALGEPVGVLQRLSGLSRNVASEVGGQVSRDLGVLNRVIGNQGGYLKLPGQSFANDLPMDTASRMQRAREIPEEIDIEALLRDTADIKPATSDGKALAQRMAKEMPERMQKIKALGFDTNQVVYRGLDKPYDEKVASKSIYQMFTHSGEQAGEYAGNPSGGNVVPAFIRKGRNLQVEAGRSNFNAIDVNGLPDEIRSGIRGTTATTDQIAQAAKRAGYESITINNVFDNAWGERVGKPTNVEIVFDPKNIRSVNAVFDPAKKDSANLLAGIAPIGVVGLLSLGSGKAQAEDLGTAGLLLKPNPKTPVRINVTPTRMK